jgi:hypothetical protein
MNRLRTSIKDRNGRIVRKGDVVRVLGVPKLNGMRSPYREETERVFRHIKGRAKRVHDFDRFGCAILVFRILKGRSRGWHSVAIEPELIRRVSIADGI